MLLQSHCLQSYFLIESFVLAAFFSVRGLGVLQRKGLCSGPVCGCVYCVCVGGYVCVCVCMCKKHHQLI